MIRTLIVCAGMLLPAAALAQIDMPVVSDSRIKTLVYNPNDVYSLLTHYGYQSNIEFSERETINTVSVGDRVAWQIIPAGNRLFIKAMEEGAHTNMTVVTNKRAYQFDLRSSSHAPLEPSQELVYVVRFFYPDEQAAMPNPPIYSDQPEAMMPATAPVSYAPPTDMAPSYNSGMKPFSATMPTQLAPASLNYHYTLSGPDAIAPVQVYDDGQSTHIRFAPGFNDPVQVFAMLSSGQLQALPANRSPEGDLIVPAVQPKLMIQSQGQQVILYNESVPSA